MSVLERLKAVLNDAELPDWVREVRVELMDDQFGDDAARVDLVLREGREELVYDGEELNRAVGLVHAAFHANGIRLWPYVHFLSSADAA
jgi:hypothetical protein